MASDDEVAATVEDRPRSGSGPERLDPSELPRGTTIDRYVLIDKVGQGGMGVVYSAYDHVLDRRVAVKLLTGRGDRDGASLLLAEARAMAQLAHPAIVPVHDVGEFRGRVFLAMAFVEGTTLRAWQAREERRWQELVAMYRALGEGLAFAHDEGIIHRDFKPDNVLVDDDGRPHITDFGLAKIVLDAGPAAPSPHATHTITGKVAGTPGYMSPQQSRGEPTDARTDQYAFCASLFEALHGGLPHQSPPPRADVPRRILAAIERGLDDEPGKRWPSMRELLAALAPPAPARRRRVLVAAAAAIAVPAAFAVGLATHHGAAHGSCALPRAQAMWQARRGQVQAALAAQGQAGADVVAALDAWTARWTDMAESSCRATAAGSQSRQLGELRARCLDHALDVTSSLVELASHAGPELARNARGVAANLPALEPCADAAGLLATAPLPADPVRRAAVAALDRQLARAQALVTAESFREAAQLLDALAGPVAATGYPPLAFELYDTRSSVEIARQSDPDAAAAAAWSAIAVDPTREDAAVASVWIDLVWIVGVMQHAPAQAIELGRVAEAIEARVQDRHQQALLDHRLAMVLTAAGKLDEAIPRFERAAAGFAADGDVQDQITSLNGEAEAVAARGDLTRALALYQRAVALAAAKPHSQLLLADVLSELSIVQNEAGKTADARASLQRALVAIGDGRDDPALLAAIHGNLGNVDEAAGDLAAAERDYREGLEISRASLGPDTSDVQLAWFNLGNIQLERKELADALGSLGHALDILSRAPREAGNSSDYAGPGDLARRLVQAHLALAHPADALAAAEACLALAQRDGVHPGALADVHFALATAAWAAGDRGRARETMRVAAAEYRTAQASSDDADRWLATHGGVTAAATAAAAGSSRR